MNKIKRKRSAQASIRQQGSMATNVFLFCLWERSDEDVEWNVNVLPRISVNCHENSFIRDSSSSESSCNMCVQSLFLPVATTICEVYFTVSVNYENYETKMLAIRKFQFFSYVSLILL